MRYLVKFNDVSSLTSFNKSRTNIRHLIIENEHASFVKNEIKRSKKLTMRWLNMITKTNRFKQFQTKNKSESHFSDHISHFETQRKTRYQHTFAAIRINIHCNKQIFIKKSSLICIHRNNDSFTEFHQIVQKEKLMRAKKFIIVMFSKKSSS
jgi:hypothetical protein